VEKNGVMDAVVRDLQILFDMGVIVLCELEGRTHKEAASQLGWPIGTVSSRLSRAKSMLARRLSRQGVSLSVSSLAVLLVQESASASMPPG
jgi:Sigma-70, region 4